MLPDSPPPQTSTTSCRAPAPRSSETSGCTGSQIPVDRDAHGEASPAGHVHAAASSRRSDSSEPCMHPSSTHERENHKDKVTRNSLNAKPESENEASGTVNGIERHIGPRRDNKAIQYAPAQSSPSDVLSSGGTDKKNTSNQLTESAKSSEHSDKQAVSSPGLSGIDFGDGDGDGDEEEEEEEEEEDDDDDDDDDDVLDSGNILGFGSGSFHGMSALAGLSNVSASVSKSASDAKPTGGMSAALPPAGPGRDDSESTMSVRKSLLDAIVEHQARRISELERRLDKKRAKIELLSATPAFHPGVPGLGFFPPHPAAAVGHSAVAAAAAAHVHQQAQAAAQHNPYFLAGATGNHMLGLSQAATATHPTTSDADHKQSRYWTADEHQRFLQAVKQCGPKNYVQIAEIVGTRNAKQVRTHAQKFQKKLEREDAKARRSGGSMAHAASVAAAAAAVAGGAAPPPSAMVAAAAAAHAAMQGYDGPSSSESGKSHYLHDAVDAHGLQVACDGASSTNYISPDSQRAAAILGLNANNLTPGAGELSSGEDASAAAAAMAAIAAEAKALKRSALPGAMVNSEMQTLHTNMDSVDCDSPSDRQTQCVSHGMENRGTSQSIHRSNKAAGIQPVTTEANEEHLLSFESSPSGKLNQNLGDGEEDESSTGDINPKHSGDIGSGLASLMKPGAAQDNAGRKDVGSQEAMDNIVKRSKMADGVAENTRHVSLGVEDDSATGTGTAPENSCGEEVSNDEHCSKRRKTEDAGNPVGTEPALQTEVKDVSESKSSTKPGTGSAASVNA